MIKKLVSGEFVWKGLAEDVAEWVHAYITCQASKVNKRINAPLEQIDVPEKHFAHIQVDLLGTCLVVTDLHTYSPLWIGSEDDLKPFPYVCSRMLSSFSLQLGGKI